MPVSSTNPLAHQVCPLCQTTAGLAAPDAGAAWLCARCGQRWTADRLASVTAYAAWVAERELIPVPVRRS